MALPNLTNALKTGWKNLWKASPPDPVFAEGDKVLVSQISTLPGLRLPEVPGTVVQKRLNIPYGDDIYEVKTGTGTLTVFPNQMRSA